MPGGTDYTGLQLWVMGGGSGGLPAITITYTDQSGNGGATWSNLVRVSASMVPTDLGRIAAADRHVYAVWQRRDAKKGLAALCIGGGMGVSLALER